MNMAPAKRKKKTTEQECDPGTNTKRASKSDIEKHICKKKLEALAHEESQSKDDRFSLDERKRLIDAFNEHGYHVFGNTKLLHRYFPTRRESDLKGLLHRLKASCTDQKEESPLEDWQKLCQQLMGNFAKSRHINLDDIFSDALRAEVDSRLQQIQSPSTTCDTLKQAQSKPDYLKLLESFAQLLQGKFPDSMSPVDAKISMKLFEHINNVVDSIDLENSLSSIRDGSWLNTVMEDRRTRQDMALKGLDEIDGITKKCPTMRDIEKDRNIEALCLELPKIKRITDVMNPLNLYELESLVKFDRSDHGLVG